jgi:hypothetical protein
MPQTSSLWQNKDHEHLAQINLRLLFGQQSRLPLYYRKLAGNIPDVKTLKKLLTDMNTLGYEKIKIVLDQGSFSAANILALFMCLSPLLQGMPNIWCPETEKNLFGSFLFRLRIGDLPLL